MSGTSADGVDVAIVSIEGRALEMTARLITHRHVPYDSSIRKTVFQIRQEGKTELSIFARLAREISQAYAQCVQETLKAANMKATDLTAVAAHGQTLFHAPPTTIQLLDPSHLAAELMCTVVSDFRRADCAAGGQGAPLVPFADYILFRDPTKSRILLNIGGISNLTWLKAGGATDQVIAFDTGPGNCVIDYLCRQHDADGPGYDVGGIIGGRGSPVRSAIEELFQKSYFLLPPPKSTDGPAMIELFESIQSLRDADFNSRVATATLWTVASIQNAILQFLPQEPWELIVSGGGSENRTIMDHLRRWRGSNIRTSDEFGVPSAAKEAIAFALLGAATLDGVPSNIPSATGAKRAAILGSITPKP